MVSLRQARDLTRFQQPSAFRHVGLDDGGCLFLHHPAEAVSCVDVLAAGDGDRDRPPHQGHRIQIVARHRFLEPHRTRGSHRPANLNGCFRVVAGVAFQGQFHLRPDQLSSRIHSFHDLIDLGIRNRPMASLFRVKLLAGVAAIGDVVDSHLECTNTMIADYRPGIVTRSPQVNSHLVPHLASEEPVDRRPKSLTGQVP